MISKPNMPRWHDVLVAIHRSRERNRYCEKLNRVVKGSRSHLRELVKQLTRLSLIEIQPTSKIKRLALTEKGRKIVVSIMEIRSQIGML